jgi:hypothetical protein
MSCAKFDDVLNSLPDDLRDLVKNKLANLAEPPAGQQAVANLRAEDYVDEKIWLRLVDKLRSCPDEWDQIHDAVRDVMRSDQLNGPAANCPTDTIFGRATSEDDLASVLTENGHHGSKVAATEEIYYNKRIPADELCLAWESYKLGTHVMWATFDVDGEEPFAKVAWDADHIRAHLGLSKLDIGKPLLLLRYKLPAEKARLPRVTEAYSSDIWKHYFRAAGTKEQKDGYGRSFPWDELAEDGGLGLPEVVHEPIHGSSLEDSLTEVK